MGFDLVYLYLANVPNNFSSLSVLEWGLFPLDVGSVVTTSGDDVSVLLILVPESDSWDVLGVTGHPSAWLSVLEDWELVDSDGSEVITGDNVLSILGGIDGIDISSIGTLRVDSSDLPTELAGGSLPDGWIGQSGLPIWDLAAVLHIVEDLSVGLIDSS